MNTDPATVRCPKCDGTIPADAPQGLCPRCVLAGAASPTDPGIRSRSGLAAPPLEAVAAAFPQFEILGLVGLGGMGVVYKVRQPKLDRIVALKLLPMSLSADPAFAERFHREARFLARLSHPQIVSVYDFGESGGFCYLLMEFVDGVNLRQAMRAGRFTPDQALAVVPDICAALQYAHDQGVLHRDIKPENILLDAQGRVKIADFGIAKLVGDPGDPRTDLTLTQSGARLGTPHYMAPEQIEKPSDVDHRADIYSLGVVFYELLTGELPLGRFAPPSAKTPLDARVDEIVLRALAKERELRQQSAGEVKTQVEGLGTKAVTPPPITNPQPAPAPAGPTPPLPSWATRTAWLFLSLSGLGCILALSDLVPWGIGFYLALTSIALFTRSRPWRMVALAVNITVLVLGMYSLCVTPLVLLSGAKIIGPGITIGQVLWGQFSLLGCVAATWVLCHRAVRPAFAIETPRLGDRVPDLWVHRISWLVLALVLLPISILVAGMLAGGTLFGPVNRVLAGLVPFLTGVLLVAGFLRSQSHKAHLFRRGVIGGLAAITLLSLVKIVGLRNPPVTLSSENRLVTPAFVPHGTAQARVEVTPPSGQATTLRATLWSNGVPMALPGAGVTLTPELAGPGFLAATWHLRAGLEAGVWELSEPVVGDTGRPRSSLRLTLPAEVALQPVTSIASAQPGPGERLRRWLFLPAADAAQSIPPTTPTWGVSVEIEPQSAAVPAAVVAVNPQPAGSVPADREVAQLELKFAQNRLAELRRKADVGAVAPRAPEVLDAELAVAVAKAALKGDPLAAAQARLVHAESLLAITHAMQTVGKATLLEIEAAELAVAKAKAEVKQLDADRGPTGAGAGHPGRAQFFGEVTGQIELPAGRPTKLTEAILSLGKTSEVADLRKVKVRRADGTAVVVDVWKVIQENRRDLDLDLRDGDRVEVPKRIL